jgi:hypothetical protein
LAPKNDVERVGGAALNATGTAAAYVLPLLGGKSGEGGIEPVRPYEVGTYGELKVRSVTGDGLTLDHIPSNASNLLRAEAELGRPLTPAEAAAVRDQGISVAVPDPSHRSGSPTYGGRNTAEQIAADAADPQAAAARDSQAMVNSASPTDRAAAQAAAVKIRQTVEKQ